MFYLYVVLFAWKTDFRTAMSVFVVKCYVFSSVVAPTGHCTSALGPSFICSTHYRGSDNCATAFSRNNTGVTLFVCFFYFKGTGVTKTIWCRTRGEGDRGIEWAPWDTLYAQRMMICNALGNIQNKNTQEPKQKNGLSLLTHMTWKNSDFFL